MEVSLPHQIAALPFWLGILLTAGVPVLLALGIGHVVHAVFTPLELAARRRAVDAASRELEALLLRRMP